MESGEQIEKAISDLISPDRDVAGEAWRQLIKIGLSAVPHIVRAMKSDNVKMRERAAEVFSSPGLRAPEAVDALIVALKDPVSMVRLIAAQSLSRQMDLRASDALIAALEDASGVVRGSAMSSLAILKDPRAFDLALNMINNDADVDARCGAAHALARLQDVRVLPVLLDMLRSENDEDRMGAAHALAWTADKRAIPALTDALSDRYRLVRRFAQLAISQISSEGDDG